MAEASERRDSRTSEIVRNAVQITLVVGTFATLFIVLWLAFTAVIAIVAGISFAVLFDRGARVLGHILPWTRKLRLFILFVLVALLIAMAMWWGGTIFVKQANDFLSAMEALLKRAGRFVESGGFGLPANSVDLTHFIPASGVLFGGVRTVATTIFGVIALATAILFLGAFFSWSPELYKAMVLSLLPRDKRERVSEVMDFAAHAMREWLIGQSISMLAIFLFSLAALLLVGMPYPLLLAVQAGLLTFIPTLGPFIAGVVTILAGLSQSLTMAAYGLATYILIQFLESHLITPVVQERTIRLPPAGTLALQLIAAFLFGVLGVAFIVPFAAAGKVLIEELYVKDWLGGGWPLNQQPSQIGHWLDFLIGRLRRRR